jgi:hypothetical protein
LLGRFARNFDRAKPESDETTGTSIDICFEELWAYVLSSDFGKFWFTLWTFCMRISENIHH